MEVGRVGKKSLRVEGSSPRKMYSQSKLNSKLNCFLESRFRATCLTMNISRCVEDRILFPLLLQSHLDL